MKITNVYDCHYFNAVIAVESQCHRASIFLFYRWKTLEIIHRSILFIKCLLFALLEFRSVVNSFDCDWLSLSSIELHIELFHSVCSIHFFSSVMETKTLFFCKLCVSFRNKFHTFSLCTITLMYNFSIYFEMSLFVPPLCNSTLCFF